jgi:hypothetical protein
VTGLKLGEGLRLPLELATEPLGILANRGRGKTYAAHVLVEEVSDAGVPVVILDVKGDWWGVRSNAAGTGVGLPAYIFGGDHADLPLEPTAGELLADLVVDERVSVVLDMSELSKTKARTFATAFAERLYRRNRLPVFVVVDEADVLVPQRQSAETARLIGAMEDLAKRGRGRGIGMAVVTQRPQEVAKSVLDLMETLLLLGMTGPRALKSVRDWTTIHVDEEEPDDLMRALPHMRVGEVYVWSPVHDVLKRGHVRKLRTFDSHPTPKVGEVKRQPRKWSELDLEQLGAKIASTVERAKDNDPRLLRVQLEQERKRAEDAERHAARVEEYAGRLEQQLEEQRATPAEQIPVVTDEQLDELRGHARELAAVASQITEAIGIATLPRDLRPSSPLPTVPAAPARPAPTPTPKRAALEAFGSRGSSDDDGPGLRKGAVRMVEALARMHPHRLTREQWATAARMKATGGTWSTYVGDIRKRGLLDESEGRYSLTEAGHIFAGSPKPLTAQELQDYYHGPVLREGARRLLDVLIEAYPAELSRDECGERADLSNGGTLSTYLGDLVKHGVAEASGKGGPYRATDLLMYGAQLPQ